MVNNMTNNVMGTFFPKEEGFTYEVNEGNVSINEGYSVLNRSRQKYLTFANPVYEECFLQFDDTAELTVKPAGSGYATHITMYDPQFPAGKLPQEAINDGSYRRYVTANQLKTGEMILPLADDNAAISVGDYLSIKSYDEGLDATAEESSTVTAREAKAANSGGYIIVFVTEPRIPVEPSG